MKPITREWVEKAEGDWHTASRELRVRAHPNYDAVCFHAQQCAEKYLKACLQEAGVTFTRTHNLSDLLALAVTIEPALAQLSPALIVLTSYAVDVRYPGAITSRTEARTAMRACRVVRGMLRSSLGLGS
jgi:HEPN domain-containing protein